MRNYLKKVWQDFCEYLDFCDQLEKGLDPQQQKEVLKSGSLRRVRKTIREQTLADDVVLMLFEWQLEREKTKVPPLLFSRGDVVDFYEVWHGFSNKVYVELLKLPVDRRIDLGAQRFIIKKAAAFGLEESETKALRELLALEDAKLEAFIASIETDSLWLRDAYQATELIGRTTNKMSAGLESREKGLPLKDEEIIQKLLQLRPVPEIQPKLFALQDPVWCKRRSEFTAALEKMTEVVPHIRLEDFWIAEVRDQALKKT